MVNNSQMYTSLNAIYFQARKLTSFTELESMRKYVSATNGLPSLARVNYRNHKDARPVVALVVKYDLNLGWQLKLCVVCILLWFKVYESTVLLVATH